MNSIRSLGALAFCVIASLAVGSCRESPHPTESATHRIDGDTVVFDAKAPQLASFISETVVAAPPPAMSFTGRLSWDEDRTVRVLSPVAGRVVEAKAMIGSRVRTGDVLARLSSPEFGQAQADALRAEADVALAGKTLARQTRLLEGGSGTRRDLEAAEAELARAKAESSRTLARLSQWGSKSPGLDQLFPLTTSLSGIVVERNLNPGLEVRPDAPVPLFVITDPTRLWVQIDLPERELAALRPGASLTIRSAAYQDRPHPGRLEFIGAALDRETRTIKARGWVDNREGLLKAEMYVTVDAADVPKALPMVPSKAVLTDGERRFVFVSEAPGRFRCVHVTVGVERGGRVPILGGLESGARVVTEGSLLLAAVARPEKV